MGYLILQAEGIFEVNTVFAGIVVLTACVLLLNGVVGRLEWRLMKWQPCQGYCEKLQRLGPLTELIRRCGNTATHNNQHGFKLL